MNLLHTTCRDQITLMSEDFDPYYRWLGIPAEEQPPHHYRLLGVQAFEADTDVINNAADRQMNYVRTFQMGRRGQMAEEILNKIAVAKVCLLSPTQKAEYDRRLTDELGTQAAATTAQAETAAPQTEIAASPPEAPAEAPPPRISIDASGAGGVGRHRTGRQKSNKRSWQKTSTIVAVTVVVLLLLINGGIWAYKEFFQSDPANQANAASGDGRPLDITEVPRGQMPPGDNVLDALDLDAGTVRGTWMLDGEAIVSDRTAYATVQLPEDLPPNYTLALSVKRQSGGEALSITLPVGGSRCTIVLDGGRAKSSGIELINGANHKENSTTRVGQVLATDRDVVIQCRVKPDNVYVEINGQMVIDWTGDAAELSVPHYWDAPQKSGILLGTNRSAFRIEQVVIVRQQP